MSKEQEYMRGMREPIVLCAILGISASIGNPAYPLLPEELVSESSYKELGIRPTFSYWRQIGVTNLRIRNFHQPDPHTHKMNTISYLIGDYQEPNNKNKETL